MTKEPMDYPSVEQLNAELKRVKYQSRYLCIQNRSKL